jgi:hypothetical protein
MQAVGSPDFDEQVDLSADTDAIVAGASRMETRYVIRIFNAGMCLRRLMGGWPTDDGSGPAGGVGLGADLVAHFLDRGDDQNKVTVEGATGMVAQTALAVQVFVLAVGADFVAKQVEVGLDRIALDVIDDLQDLAQVPFDRADTVAQATGAVGQQVDTISADAALNRPQVA